MSKKEAVTTTASAITPQVINPFQPNRLPDHVNAGTVEIESQRAIAEVQASVMVAKARPRDQALAFERTMQACSRYSFASKAFYAYPRGGETITGVTIRFAEELARNWGNIDYGFRELSKKDGETEMEAYAWDLETNTRSSQRFTVSHERHTRKGVQELTDPRDIYEVGANNGARRLRARILAILPPDLIQAAEEMCRATLATGGNGAKPFADRIMDMVMAFSKLGVNKAHIEARLKKPVDQILPDELADLGNIYNSIRNGETKTTEWFGGQAQETPDSIADLNNQQQQQQPAQRQQEKKPAGNTAPPATPQAGAHSEEVV